MDGCTEGVADTELHQSSKELSNAAKEDSQSKDGLVRADAAKGVRSREAIHRVSTAPSIQQDYFNLPSTALIQAKNKRRQSETDQTQWTRVGNSVEGRVVDLRHHGLVRLLDMGARYMMAVVVATVVMHIVLLIGIMGRGAGPVGRRGGARRHLVYCIKASIKLLISRRRTGKGQVKLINSGVRV